MNILFFGDVVGRSGRDGLAKHIPALRSRFNPDVIIANVENAAAGHGISESMAKELLGIGVNVMTTGNHVWGQRDLITSIDRMPFLLRPLNYPSGTPGRGYVVHALPAAGGRKVLIINSIARLFMDPLVDDPFAAILAVVQKHTLGSAVDAIFVDFHGEASSEKAALANMLDGQVSAIVGTHTHVPTADARILPAGTAFMTDAGMCGDYNSVIGVRTDIGVNRFTRKLPERLQPADGEATICGVFIATNESGRATHIEPVRTGGVLAAA